jgi:hypothetical protein
MKKRLPLAAGSRYESRPEMGYFGPETAPAKSDLTAKNRVWGFFGESVSVCLETRPAVRKPLRKNHDDRRGIVSGIRFWPGRDPIGENGGINLYAFVRNDGVNGLDILGLQARMICNRCERTQGPMNCITQDDDGNISDPFTTNDPDDPDDNRGNLPAGEYDIRPKPPSSMEPGNENLTGGVENGRVTGPGGTEYPVGTPSITGQFPNAIPGQLRRGGTTNYRIHGPGLSLGCITTGRCGDIQDMMEEHEDDGGMTLTIYDVCCEEGEGPPVPAPRAWPVR